MVNRPGAIAITASLFCVGGVVCAALALGRGGEPELAEAVAEARSGFWELLEAVPRERRDADWSYLRALGHVARGEESEAGGLARALADGGDPRGVLLESFLRLHDPQRSAAAGAPLPKVTATWRGNRPLRRALRLLEWTGRHLGARIPEPSALVDVFHHGLWPAPLPERAGMRPAEPGAPGARLEWLRDRRETLLQRLSGALPGGRRQPGAADGRPLLVSFIGDDADLIRLAGEVRRLSVLLGDRTPVMVWILDAGVDEGRWRSAVGRLQAPLFIATCGGGKGPALPGFGEANLSVLLDERLRVRMVIDRWLPLPIAARKLSEVLSRRR